MQSYQEFWPHYLQEHSRWGTKVCHCIGVLLAFVAVAVGFWERDAKWFAGALVLGYLPDWFSHFFIEKNRPASWKHPYWSFISNFRMVFLFLTGRLKG